MSLRAMTSERGSLKLDRVTVRYPGGGGVSDASVEVPPGGCLTLVGPSGGGKTTILRAIAGLEPVQCGAIYLGKRDLTRLPPHRRGVEWMPQGEALLPHRTLMQQVTPRRWLGGWNRSRADELSTLAASIGVEDCWDRYPDQMSGGQRRRSAVLRSFASERPVVLLDEPLAGLNDSLSVDLAAWIFHQHRRRRSKDPASIEPTSASSSGGPPTAILVCATHRFDRAAQLGGPDGLVAVIDRGRMVQIDSPEGIANEPLHLAVVQSCHGDERAVVPIECTRAPGVTPAVAADRPAMAMAVPADGCRIVDAERGEPTGDEVWFQITAARSIGPFRYECSLGGGRAILVDGSNWDESQRTRVQSDVPIWLACDRASVWWFDENLERFHPHHGR